MLKISCALRRKVSALNPHFFGDLRHGLTSRARFAEEILPYSEQINVLKNLVQTYLATFAELGIETWLMHGSLLGWWWGKKVCFPTYPTTLSE